MLFQWELLLQKRPPSSVQHVVTCRTNRLMGTLQGDAAEATRMEPGDGEDGAKSSVFKLKKMGCLDPNRTFPECSVNRISEDEGQACDYPTL